MRLCRFCKKEAVGDVILLSFPPQYQCDPVCEAYKEAAKRDAKRMAGNRANTP